MGSMMMRPSRALVREFGIPKSVLHEAYRDNPDWQTSAATAMRKVRVLCRELGLVNPLSRRIWKRRKIWADD